MVDYYYSLSEQLSKMFSDIKEFYKVAKDVENKRREQGEFFNVFGVIGLRTDEVRLHSALLAELLYPRGEHGVGNLFLKAFLEIIGIEEGYIDYNRCSSNLKERYIGTKTASEGGRIDIIIEDGNHALIIENKIYAADQENQLLRYYNYGRKKFPDGFKLLYLTLEGCEPDECSLGGYDFDKQIISYKDEIVKWLEKCSELAKGKENAQIIINQYCCLIKELTQQDMDKKYLEQLKAITLAPENLIAVGEILKMSDEWFEEVRKRFIWQPIMDFAKHRGMEYGENGDSAWIYKPEWKYYGIFIESDRSGYYVGISYYNEPNRANRLYIKDQKVLSCLREKPSPEIKIWPYGWEYLKYRIWNYNIVGEIIGGDVFAEIKRKFEDILTEIEERCLRMP